jgi:hypothetical protein
MDQYQYHDGKLSILNTYRWKDSGKWEKIAQCRYTCWPNNFLVTEYNVSDSSCLPVCELWAKFENGKPEEIIKYVYKGDMMQMQALQKWIYTFSNGNLICCELQAYQNLEWQRFFKTENTYTGSQLIEMKSYNYQDDEWILSGYSEFDYNLNHKEEIRNFVSQEGKWILNKKYKFQYSNALLSVCSCYKPGDQGNSLRIDCTTHYRYDENRNLVYECFSNKDNIIEKFYTYEDSSGNYGCTLGNICTAINFPMQLPNPI